MVFTYILYNHFNFTWHFFILIESDSNLKGVRIRSIHLLFWVYHKFNVEGQISRSIYSIHLADK